MTKTINGDVLKLHEAISFSDRPKDIVILEKSDELNVDYISINGNIKRLEKKEGE